MAKTTAAVVAPASPDLTDPFIYYFQRKEDSGDTMKAIRIFNAYIEKHLKGDVRDTVLELNDALCFSIEKQGFRAGFKAATAEERAKRPKRVFGRAQSRFNPAKLYAYMIDHDLSNAALGAMVGLSRASIAAYRSGLRNPTEKNYQSICRVLRVPLESFLDY